ncbi:ATP-binding protein [Geovibrio thiophilus]|uniref:ATP-binding protein n=1 Tax=Geovibrio thiophilus TaxID=139438 RepID=UPI0013E3D494|nr:ATP-binding protein [Geovibrio thiophilus]
MRRIIKVSGGTERVLEYSAEELTGRTIDSFYKYPSVRNAVEDSILREGLAEDISVTLVTRNGEEVNATESIFIIRDAVGKASGFEGIIRRVNCPDYTSFSGGSGYQKVLQNVIDSLPAAVCWKDRDLRYTGCNRSFLDLAGAHSDEVLIGRTDEQLFTDEEFDRFSKGDREIAAGRCSSYNYVETVYIKTTGEFRWFDITKTAVRNERGQFAGVVSIHDDITTWVNAELGIQNRLWFEQQIMEISAGFINLSAEEVDSGINSALEKIGTFVDAERCCVFSMDRDSMRASVTHEWTAAGVPSLMKRMKSVSLLEMELLMEKLAGREIINITSLSGYRKCSEYEREYLNALGVKSLIIVPMIKEGKSTGFMTFSSLEKERDWDDDIVSLLTIVSEILVNVLDRKYMQEELMELYALMEEKVRHEVERSMEHKKLLIQQSKLAAMGEMLGNIAHQWRQPLNALNLSFFELKYIKDSGELTDDKLKDILDRVNALIQQMSATVDDFRNFFKENKEQAEFLLSDCVRKALYLVQAFFEEHRIDVELRIDSELMVSGYPGELAQVFLNILNNAKDALTEKNVAEPQVIVRVYYENGKAVAEIEDNAGGVNEGLQERIFEPYFTTKPEGKGTGIGLYMSKMIVENSMPGQLSVRNTDKGACFRIELPSIQQ